MSIFDRTIAHLRHELRMARLGRGLDVARLEKRLAEVLAERDAAEDRYQESLARVRADLWAPKYTPPTVTYHQGLGLIAMGMDETCQEARKRAERDNVN